MNLVAILDRIPGNVSMNVQVGPLGAAAFSGEPELYRYLLSRPLVPAESAPLPNRAGTVSVCAFVMLNPSTATADVNDPTIRRCMGFARGWGYEHAFIANAYAWRATDPKALVRERKNGVDVVGEYNDRVIRALAEVADLVVCAWGANIEPIRARLVVKVIREAGKVPHVIRLTKAKHPEHPLYLPGVLTPTPWEP